MIISKRRWSQIHWKCQRAVFVHSFGVLETLLILLKNSVPYGKYFELATSPPPSKSTLVPIFFYSRDWKAKILSGFPCNEASWDPVGANVTSVTFFREGRPIQIKSKDLREEVYWHSPLWSPWNTDVKHGGGASFCDPVLDVTCWMQETEERWDQALGGDTSPHIIHIWPKSRSCHGKT